MYEFDGCLHYSVQAGSFWRGTLIGTASTNDNI